MYRRTAKSAHYLPRTGSYSTVPHRNGRVDVLPPSASDSLYQTADQIDAGRQRLEQLRETRERLAVELKRLTDVEALRARHSTRTTVPPARITQLRDELSRVDAEAKKIRRHVGNLTALVGATREMSFESAFVRLAKAELSEHAWRSIAQKAMELVTRIRGKQ